jgi:hypothetical protein
MNGGIMGTLAEQAPMDSNVDNNPNDLVLVTLELPRDIVAWIDGLKNQLGFRNRGLIIAQLLRELQPESNEHETSEQ